MISFSDVRIELYNRILFNNLSLIVKKGEKVVIIGPSGSGKSSLLRAAVGMVPLTEGQIRIAGKVLSPENIMAIRSSMVFIPQEPLLGAETVREALLLPFSYKVHRGRTVSSQEVSLVLQQLRLDESLLSKPCKKISGGEKQRIAIARALLLRKTLFFADEVTSALDPESKNAVMEQLFRPEITLLSVSHDREWMDKCSRILEINKGRLQEVKNEY